MASQIPSSTSSSEIPLEQINTTSKKSLPTKGSDKILQSKAPVQQALQEDAAVGAKVNTAGNAPIGSSGITKTRHIAPVSKGGIRAWFSKVVHWFFSSRVATVAPKSWMESVKSDVRNLMSAELERNPAISAEQIFKNLTLRGYPVGTLSQAVKEIYENPQNQPLIEKLGPMRTKELVIELMKAEGTDDCKKRPGRLESFWIPFAAQVVILGNQQYLLDDLKARVLLPQAQRQAKEQPTPFDLHATINEYKGVFANRIADFSHSKLIEELTVLSKDQDQDMIKTRLEASVLRTFATNLEGLQTERPELSRAYNKMAKELKK
jgi:hypothetical protein